jgi:hypothetical protein
LPPPGDRPDQGQPIRQNTEGTVLSVDKKGTSASLTLASCQSDPLDRAVDSLRRVPLDEHVHRTGTQVGRETSLTRVAPGP